MLVYHGSYLVVENPDVVHSRDKLDFGKGFYVTPLREQAVKWTSRYVPRYGHGVVSRYECDEAALAACRLLDFPHYSNDWLDMIVSCRKGNDVADYDVIRGGVANDKVFNTCELFFRGLISRETALDRLRFESPNLQLCFKVQRAIRNCLTFIGSEIT